MKAYSVDTVCSVICLLSLFGMIAAMSLAGKNRLVKNLVPAAVVLLVCLNPQLREIACLILCSVFDAFLASIGLMLIVLSGLLLMMLMVVMIALHAAK
ncbi:MAG: hypothetical protein Q4D81_08675 [Eubacteriales bacterium]|nr:hypothetical protein [Eubacteriales bacterium]